MDGIHCLESESFLSCLSFLCFACCVDSIDCFDCIDCVGVELLHSNTSVEVLGIHSTFVTVGKILAIGFDDNICDNNGLWWHNLLVENAFFVLCFLDFGLLDL